MTIRETAGDRQIESYVKTVYEKKYNCELESTRTLFLYDFHAYKGQRLIAIIETRRRNCEFETYPDYWIGYEKYRKIRLAGEAFEVKAIYALVFDNGIYHVDLTKYPRLETSYGDRGNPKIPRLTDNEKVACIPKDMFKRIKMHTIKDLEEKIKQ
jgi:hypothetical protein